MNFTRLPVSIRRQSEVIPHVPNYENAVRALALCVRVDEVLKMHATAHAAAHYAKQIKDNSMVDMAERIKRRAERRLGEILETLGKGHISPALEARAKNLARIALPKFENKIAQSPVPSAARIITDDRRENGVFRGQNGVIHPKQQAADFLEDASDLLKRAEHILKSPQGVGEMGWMIFANMKKPEALLLLRDLRLRLTEMIEGINK